MASFRGSNNEQTFKKFSILGFFCDRSYFKYYRPDASGTENGDTDVIQSIGFTIGRYVAGNDFGDTFRWEAIGQVWQQTAFNVWKRGFVLGFVR